MTGLAKGTGPVSERLAPQATFIFSLMSLAARMPHRLKDGTNRTLMTFGPTNERRDSSFVIRAANILRKIWDGQGKTPAIAPRIPAWPKNMPPPQDLGIFVSMSRWVIARAHGSTAKGRNKELFRIVGAVAVQVFAATEKFAEVDPAEEKRLVRQLDTTLGYPKFETDVLLKRMQSLRAQLAPRAAVAAEDRAAHLFRDAPITRAS